MSRIRISEEGQKRRLLALFREGQKARKQGKGCESSNGTWLEGWYCPEQYIPNFLTLEELHILERIPNSERLQAQLENRLKEIRREFWNVAFQYLDSQEDIRGEAAGVIAQIAWSSVEHLIAGEIGL